MARLSGILRNRLISGLSSVNNNSGARGVVEALIQWVMECEGEVRREPFLSYGFDLIVNMDGRLDEYPFAEIGEADVGRVHSRATQLRNASDDGVAQFVRDLMEELVAVEIDRVCSRCGEAYMRAYMGLISFTPAFQCDVCGYGEFLNGSALRGERLRFITLKELESFGISWL
ncbi:MULTISPECIES: hypothetical protein [Stenotrophomonas maltophilia group]|jgi:hypothetical protein|nr:MULTISPECIES: hypothetical protein [Stenotrophomonas maltophilia group]MCZ7843067.1 hypothetical protein [Stenotrophomonas maltophilia]MDJ1624563.1 hypothetical protein [Stenotrophomonas sepilia]